MVHLANILIRPFQEFSYWRHKRNCKQNVKNVGMYLREKDIWTGHLLPWKEQDKRMAQNYKRFLCRRDGGGFFHLWGSINLKDNNIRLSSM